MVRGVLPESGYFKGTTWQIFKPPPPPPPRMGSSSEQAWAGFALGAACLWVFGLDSQTSRFPLTRAMGTSFSDGQESGDGPTQGWFSSSVELGHWLHFLPGLLASLSQSK